MLPQPSKVLDNGSINKVESHSHFRKAAVDVSRPLEKNEFQFGSLDYATNEFHFGSLDYATMVECGLFTKPESRSPQEVAPPSEKSQLQFGSLDYATVSSLGGGLSANVPCRLKAQETLLAAIDKKDEKDKASKNYSLSGLSEPLKANGTPKDLEKNVKVPSADMESLILGADDGSCSRQSIQPCSHVIDDLLINGVLEENLPVLPPKKESKKDILRDDSIAKVLLPRGLINGGNLCFLNATLQALLACSPFVRLLEGLRTRGPAKADYPTLSAFVEFIANFDMPSGSSLKRNGPAALQNGMPFSPTMFDFVLRKFTPDLSTSMSGRPRQEDAQEFLSFVMDQMHDELLKLEGQTPIANNGGLSSIYSMEDDGWETVGPKNKSAITRTQSFVPSELSDIFGGQLRSVVKAKGNKPSASVQPYLLLHLDIFPEIVHTIEDALRLFSSPETLEGYRASAGKAGLVDASKSVKIQTLPKVLILHLMRFGYGTKGSTKLLKPIRFPLEMIVGRELFVSPVEKRKYELVATITHHGREPSKGHYTADARCSNGQWLRYDDAYVAAIGLSKVLHDQAYVLFYRQL